MYGAYKTHLQKLQILQKKIIRIISGTKISHRSIIFRSKNTWV